MASWSPDHHWLSPLLAVGAAFPCEQAAELVRRDRVAAVIDLRGEACDDEAALEAAGLAFLHLPTEDLQAPDPAAIDRGVAFARQRHEQGQRVLVHCQHGIGRSAILAMSILVDGGLSPIAALRLAKDCREAVSPSPAQHAGWDAWLRTRGLAAPHFDDFAAVAYRHLRTA
jgi:protein-tyrosine phosphatase